MKRPTKDENFREIAKIVSKRSKDTPTKLGAVIVNTDDVIQSVGYNGLPRGVDDDNPERYKRPLKYKWFEHAERNAIYNFARQFLKGGSIHVVWIPCSDCARGIVQCGIAEVIIEETEVEERWKEDFTESLIMFKEAGVKVRVADSDKDITSELINNFLQKLSEINDKNGFDDDFDEEKLNSERMVLQEEIRKLKNELQDKERRHVEIFSLLESNSERIKRDIRRKIEVQQAIRATGYQQ